VTDPPVVLHVLRPYASVDDYIAAESWTVDARNMLLVGEPELPRDTAIVFDVTLGDGSRPIKAEARVIGVAEPKDGRPGGLKVRFRRYGAPTKAFIDRAVALVASGGSAEPTQGEPAAPEPSEVSAPEVSAPEAAQRFEAVPVGQSRSPDAPSALRQLRARGDQMPETPGNREYLLEKLRQRGQTEDVTNRYQRT